MTFVVRGGTPFWNSVDAINDDDLLRELYDLAFELLEDGPGHARAKPTRFALGEVLMPGWSIDLRTVDGFIGYLHPDLGHPYIYLLKLVLY